jgi:hypothetical protein
LKLTSSRYERQKLIDDDNIPEPLGGAHYDRFTFKSLEEYGEGCKVKTYQQRVNRSRMDKYSMGEFKVNSY